MHERLEPELVLHQPVALRATVRSGVPCKPPVPAAWLRMELCFNTRPTGGVGHDPIRRLHSAGALNEVPSPFSQGAGFYQPVEIRRGLFRVVVCSDHFKQPRDHRPMVHARVPSERPGATEVYVCELRNKNDLHRGFRDRPKSESANQSRLPAKSSLPRKSQPADATELYGLPTPRV